MSDFRLGDVIDDYCVKCRRITNHSIVSIINGEAAKVRCRTCYNDHDYRHEIAPPSKKDLKKAELFKEVLSKVDGSGAAVAGVGAAEGASAEVAGPVPVEAPVVAESAPAEGARKPRGKGKGKKS